MKILRKSIAMLLAIAMMLSIMSIGVFATETPQIDVQFIVDKNVVKIGGSVLVSFKVTSSQDNLDTSFTSIAVGYDSENYTAEVISNAEGVTPSIDAATNELKAATFNSYALKANGVIYATFKLTPKVNSEVAAKAILTIGATAFGFAGPAPGYAAYTVTAGDSPLVAIKESFNVNHYSKAYATGIGTSADDIITALGDTATAYENADETTGKTAEVKVGTWTAPADFNADDTSKTYAFTAPVLVDENADSLANVTANQTATATVTLGKINLADTTVTTDAPAEKEYMLSKTTGDKKTDAQIIDDLPKTVKVKNGVKYEETADIAWSVKTGSKTELDLNKLTSEEQTNIVTLEGKITPSATNANTNYTGEKTVECVAKVVPAEIEGGSISINNPIDNGYVTANITVPASEVAKMPKIDEDKDDKDAKAAKKAKRTVLVTVESKKTDVENAKGEYEFTNDDIDKAIAAVAAATAEKPADPITVPAIKVDKKMKDLGYSSSSANKTFTVTVTVGGTQLVQKDKDGKVVPVSGEVKKATSGNAGGIHKGGSTTTTYAVTVVETKNGTATVSPEKAASGATVTVKPEPAEGYKVKSVTAVKADGTNVPVDEKAYTFTMPASAVKVTVEFEEGKNEPSVDPTPADDKFADVADDFWAAKDIYTLKDAGIIGGKSATEFDPEGDVTRAEFAKMVVGLFGYKATSDAVNFEDCKAEDWFTPYVAAGVEAGVIKGVSDTEFAPNATITREDACTILGRALNKVAQSNELKFTDADKVAEYAAPYVALLSELGYVNGYEDGSFAPTNNITRAEAAKIIAGIYNAKDTTVTEDKTDAADTTDANVEGENTTAPVEENAEDVTPEK